MRGAIGVRPSAFAVGLAILPLAGVPAAIVHRRGALAVFLTVLKLADVLAAIGVRPSALAMALVVLPLAGVPAPIGPRDGGLAMALVVLPLADVLAAIGVRPSALAVRLAFAICLAGVRHAASIGAPASCRLVNSRILSGFRWGQ